MFTKTAYVAGVRHALYRLKLAWEPRDILIAKQQYPRMFEGVDEATGMERMRQFAQARARAPQAPEAVAFNRMYGESQARAGLTGPAAGNIDPRAAERAAFLRDLEHGSRGPTITATAPYRADVPAAPVNRNYALDYGYTQMPGARTVVGDLPVAVEGTGTHVSGLRAAAKPVAEESGGALAKVLRIGARR